MQQGRLGEEMPVQLSKGSTHVARNFATRAPASPKAVVVRVKDEAGGQNASLDWWRALRREDSEHGGRGNGISGIG